jgi:hypothetical protein
MGEKYLFVNFFQVLIFGFIKFTFLTFLHAKIYLHIIFGILQSFLFSYFIKRFKVKKFTCYYCYYFPLFLLKIDFILIMSYLKNTP